MVVAFDLDDTLYHEMEYVRSAYSCLLYTSDAADE